MTYPIPQSAFDDRLGFVGTAGSGKTYAAGTLAERLLNTGRRVVIIDPLGAWWGLRLKADGKTPAHGVVIFGGAHGDIPLTPHSGALIGETVAGMSESCILDLSQMGTKAAERRFMLAFLEALYRGVKGDPVHVIFDEADMWAPQKLLDKEGEAAKLLGMMETIVRRGRIKGFIPHLISQRPAVVSKDVLSQVDGLIILKLTSSQDRKAIGAWVEGQADEGQWAATYDELPTLPRGRAVVWLPAHGILAEADFPAKTTFDSSAAPKRGAKPRAAELRPLDVGKLKERLSSIETEAKANDPKVLRSEVARLQAELKRTKSVTQVDSAAVQAAATMAREQAAKAALDRARSAFARMDSEICAALQTAQRELDGGEALAIETKPPARVDFLPLNGAGAKLPPGERAILIAAVQYGGVDRDQLSVLTGYKRSSRDAYIARLKEKGLVEVSGQTVTPAGRAAAALGSDYQPLPVGRDLQDYWFARLPEGERKILYELVAAYPQGVARASLDETTGYKRSSRDAYIARLKSRRLVTIDGAAVTASEPPHHENDAAHADATARLAFTFQTPCGRKPFLSGFAKTSIASAVLQLPATNASSLGIMTSGFIP